MITFLSIVIFGIQGIKIFSTPIHTKMTSAATSIGLYACRTQPENYMYHVRVLSACIHMCISAHYTTIYISALLPTTKVTPMKYRDIIGTLIGVGLIIYFVYTIDMGTALTHLKTASLTWVLAGLACYFGSLTLRTHRWSMILSTSSVSFSHLLAITLLGWLANYVLPAKSGEFYRAYLLMKEDVPFSEAGPSIVIERGFDFFTLIVCALIFSLMIQVTTFYRTIQYAFLIVLPIAVVVLILFKMRKKFPKFEEYFVLFESLSKKRITILFSYSIWVWVLEILAGLFIFLSISSISFFPFALGFLIVMLAAAIPAGPGSIGTLEVAWIYTYSVLGVPEDIAGATAILFHLAQYVLVFLCGLGSFIYLHSSSGAQPSKKTKEGLQPEREPPE